MNNLTGANRTPQVMDALSAIHEAQIIEPKHSRYALIVFTTALVSAFFMFIISVRGLSPIDDHQFLVTVFQGKHFNAYIDRSLGRFFPFTGQEYIFASKLFAPSSWLFHLIEALKMAACAALLLFCLMLTQANSWTIATLWSATFFSLGFADASVRLLVGELNDLILTLVLVASLLIRDQANQLSRKHAVLTFTGIIALFAAFFYKEVMFTMALILGAAELYRHMRSDQKRGLRYTLAMIVGGLAYLVFYIIWHGVHLSGSYLAIHSTGRIDVLEAFSSTDPVIAFIVLPIGLFRILTVALDPSKQTIYDSFLITSLVYAAVFVILGMCSPYYLLPVYGLGMCGVAGALGQIKSKVIKLFSIAIAILLTINNAPVAYSDVNTVKGIANNYQEFVTATSGWIWSNSDKSPRPRNLVIVGASYGRLIEQIVSLDRFIGYTGLPSSMYSIRVTEPSDTRFSSVYGFKDTTPYVAGIGDLLIYTPFQDVVLRAPILSPSYRDIFRSGDHSAPPRWTAWDWIRHCADIDSCTEHVISNSPNTGYTVMQMVRELSQNHMISAIAKPSYGNQPLQ